MSESVPSRATRWRGVLLIAAFAALVLLLYLLRDIATPFFLAFALAYLLNPAANRLEGFFARLLPSRGLFAKVHPRSLAVAVLAFVALLVFLAVVLFVIPALYNQLAEAVAKLPDYLNSLRTRLDPMIERLNMRFPQESAEVRTRFQELVRTHVLDVGKRVSDLLGATFVSAFTLLLAMLHLLIVPVFGIFLLFDMNHIKDGAIDWVPPRHRDYVATRLEQVDTVLGAFVRGLVTVCAIMGTIYAVGFTIIGVPMGLLVGVAVGFFNVVPFMSYALGMPLALLLSWLDDQNPQRLLAIFAICSVGQFVEANWITPKVVGDKLGVHAVIILISVLIGGSLFGVLGMLLALPATAALSVFWPDIEAAYRRSRFYRGASD